MIFIPAKYGSTRVYCKNFRSFYNKLSLLQIAIIRCVEAKCGPVVVSSENISEVRLQLGLLPKKYSSGIILHDRGEKLAKDPATILLGVSDLVMGWRQNLRRILLEKVLQNVLYPGLKQAVS